MEETAEAAVEENSSLSSSESFSLGALIIIQRTMD